MDYNAYNYGHNPYQNPYPPAVQVVRVRRKSGLGGLMFFFASLAFSFYLIQGDGFETVLHKVQTFSTVFGRAKAEFVRRLHAEPRVKARKLAAVAPEVRRHVNPGPFYGRDPRAFIPYNNGIDELPKNVGRVATIKAVSFDKNAVRQCASKCSVTFKDHFGRYVTGVFFKDAHGQELLKSHGKVSIRGVVKKNPGAAYKVYISRVL